MPLPQRADRTRWRTATAGCDTQPDSSLLRERPARRQRCASRSRSTRRPWGRRQPKHPTSLPRCGTGSERERSGAGTTWRISSSIVSSHTRATLRPPRSARVQSLDRGARLVVRAGRECHDEDGGGRQTGQRAAAMCWSTHAARESTAMTSSDPIAPPASGDTTARRRRPWWMVAAPVVVLVGVGALVVSAQGTDSSEASAAPPPRFVDDTADSGVDHAYTGDFDYFVGGGVAAFDCDDDGFPDLYFAGGSSPAALYRNTSSTGGTLQFETVPSPVTDLTGGDRRLPDRHRQRRPSRSGRPAPRRERGPARARRLPLRAGDRRARHRRRRRLDDGLQRHVGGRRRSCRRWRSARTSRTTGPPVATARSCGPTATCTALRSPSRPATARCRCCSATGAAPGSATCDSRTIGTTTPTGANSSGWSLPARSHDSTRRPTDGGRSRCGAWGLRAAT